MSLPLTPIPQALARLVTFNPIWTHVKSHSQNLESMKSFLPTDRKKREFEKPLVRSTASLTGFAGVGNRGISSMPL